MALDNASNDPGRRARPKGVLQGTAAGAITAGDELVTAASRWPPSPVEPIQEVRHRADSGYPLAMPTDSSMTPASLASRAGGGLIVWNIDADDSVVDCHLQT